MPKEIRLWSDIIGNQNKKDLVINSIARDVLPSFILYEGSSGIGKSTFAKLTAKTLLCNNADGDGNPCDCCENCKAVNNNDGVSYKKINMPTLLRKSDVNTTIQEIFKIQKLADKTVYVLEEIHGLSKELQTLLLEELTKIPSDTWIISCTTRPYDLLPEIRNRALEIKLNDPTEKECISYAKSLAKEYNIQILSDGAIKELVNQCDQNPRRISEIIRVVATDNKLSYNSIEKMFGISDTVSIRKYISAVFKDGDLYEFVKLITELQEESDMYQINKKTIDFIFQYALVKAGNIKKSNRELPDDIYETLSLYMNSVEPRKLVYVVSALSDLYLKPDENKSGQKSKILSMKVKLNKILRKEDLFDKPKKQSSTTTIDSIAKQIPIISESFEFSEDKELTMPEEIDAVFTDLNFGEEFRE